MKLVNFVMLAFCGTMVLGVSSCQKFEDEVLPEQPSVKFKTRAATTVEVDYPLNLYAFADDGHCAGTQVIRKKDDAMKMSLAPGDYTFVAMAGLTDDYVMPAQPSLQGLVAMRTGNQAAHPLLMGVTSATVSQGTTVTLNLRYAVSAVTVTLTNMPDDCSEVQFSLWPVSTDMSMAGTYGNQGATVSSQCVKQQAGTWVASTFYVFPSQSLQTKFTVTMTRTDGSTSQYEYTYNQPMQANQPFDIRGTYSDVLTVGGVIQIEGWNETITVNFVFGGESSPTNPNALKVVDLNEVPDVCSIWGEGIVAQKMQSHDTLSVLYVDVYEGNKILKGELATFVSQYGTDNWRLPSREEAKVLNNCFQSYVGNINYHLIEMGYDTLKSGERYFCKDDGDDECYTFSFDSGTTISKAGEKTSYYARMVKLVKYRIKP